MAQENSGGIKMTDKPDKPDKGIPSLRELGIKGVEEIGAGRPIDNNYKKMIEISKETSPYIEEEDYSDNHDFIPLVDMENIVEDKEQIELEVEIEKKGVPIIDVERPPIPKVETDKTHYKKKTVKRREEKEKEKPPALSLKEDREMKAYAELLKIRKRKGFIDWVGKKIEEWRNSFLRFLLNYKRKRDKLISHSHITHNTSPDLKTVSAQKITEQDLKEIGRRRSFQREEDGSNIRLNAIKNKKNGVVVMTAANANDIKELYGDNCEVVESKIKG